MDSSARYSVAWVDGTAKGSKLGRGVLAVGTHLPRADLPSRADPWPLPDRRSRFAIPRLGRGVVNSATAPAFNELWFRRAPSRPQTTRETVASFFYPLDSVGDWNRLYGPAGFVQYQMAIPSSASHLVAEALAKLTEAGVPSTLAVLKRFGPADEGMLSFPMQGWTLALDIPVGSTVLPGILRRLDDLVAEAGGRVYLAKDARLSPVHLSAMYPRLDEFRNVRSEVDPSRVLRSDLSRRLGIDEARS